VIEYDITIFLPILPFIKNIVTPIPTTDIEIKISFEIMFLALFLFKTRKQSAYTRNVGIENKRLNAKAIGYTSKRPAT